MDPEEECVAQNLQENEGFRDILLEKLTGLVDEHLGDKLKLDISSIMRGEVKLDPSHYIDKVINKLVERLQALSLDSFNLPEFATSFNQSLCCLNLPGEANFKEGLISGLTSIKRFDEEKSEVVVDVVCKRMLSAKTTLGMDELVYSCPTTLNFLSLFESEAVTKAVLKQVQVSVGFGIGRDFNVDLDLFDVKSLGKIEDFAGLPNPVLQIVQTALENSIKEGVQKLLQKDIKTILTEVVQKLEFLL